MNIANRISECSKKFPHKIAVARPKSIGSGQYRYDSITFSQLEEKINRYAGGLWHEGFRAGQKVLIFVRPSLEFHALVFANFKLGLIPLFIDPGMGRKNLLRAIKDAGPECIIAEPEVHFIKTFYPEIFKSIKNSVTTGVYPFWGAGKINEYLEHSYAFDSYDWKEDELSAVLFTSGGTGKPKGVEYTQKIFKTQTDILKSLFNLDSEDVDLPGFPLFSLFTLSMGMTSVIPDMDPSKPAKADPAKLVQNILDQKVTFVAGSPAIWTGMADYCIKHKIELPSVKYLVMFGAPVSNELHQKFLKILINGTTYTPYGATESLPVTNISGREVLAETAKETDQGKGTCVGKAAPGIDIKIIAVNDGAISNISDARELASGEIGEIIVKGNVVTKSYLNLKEETKKAKIPDGDTLWHRIGDLGYLDEKNRLWFCGRKTHRVIVDGDFLCSVTCEAIFNHHPQVEKTALVSAGKVPGLMVELKQGAKIDKKILEKELFELGSDYKHTKEIKKVFYHKKFPVDVRHNIKIDRTKLSKIAQRSMS